MALAWQAEQEESCPGCKRQWAETSDPEAFEDYDTTPIVCHACAERERARKRFDRTEAGPPEGLYIAVHPREDVKLG